MAPKPFKPPRPSSTSTTSTSRNPSLSNSKPTKSGISKSNSKSRSKDTHRDSGGKISPAPRISLSSFGELSSDSEDARSGGKKDNEEEEEEEEDDDEEEESESDIFESTPPVFSSKPSKSKSKSKSKNSENPAEDIEMADPPSHSENEEEWESEADGVGEEDSGRLKLDDRKEKIPEDLVNVILHHFFRNEGTRLGREASRGVGKYLDTFVREAVARAAWMGDQREVGGEGVLEVEDLEKLAPQLLLDF